MSDGAIQCGRLTYSATASAKIALPCGVCEYQSVKRKTRKPPASPTIQRFKSCPFPSAAGTLTKRAKPACFSTVRSTPGDQLPDPGRKAVRGAGPFQYAISAGGRGSRMSTTRVPVPVEPQAAIVG